MSAGQCVFPDACRASNSCYNGRGCRGEACADAHREYGRNKKRAATRPDVVSRAAYVHAGRVRTHIAELRAAGLGLSTIGRLADVSQEKVRRLAAGLQGTLAPETNERLLAVMPSMVAPHALVDARPTHERIGVLFELGWSEAELAREVLPRLRPGDGQWQIRRILGRALVTRQVEDVVRRLCDDEAAETEAAASDPLAEFQLLAEPAPWRTEAECLRLDGGERARQAPFFPTRGESAQAAREVCERCPVAEPCLDFALATNAPGIWGATTGGERRLVRRLGWSAGEVFALAGSEPDRPLIGLLEDELQRAAVAS